MLQLVFGSIIVVFRRYFIARLIAEGRAALAMILQAGLHSTGLDVAAPAVWLQHGRPLHGEGRHSACSQQQQQQMLFL